MAGNLKGIAESAGELVSNPKRGVGGQLALCWAHRGVHWEEQDPAMLQHRAGLECGHKGLSQHSRSGHAAD